MGACSTYTNFEYNGLWISCFSANVSGGLVADIFLSAVDQMPCAAAWCSTGRSNSLDYFCGLCYVLHWCWCLWAGVCVCVVMRGVRVNCHESCFICRCCCCLYFCRTVVIDADAIPGNATQHLRITLHVSCTRTREKADRPLPQMSGLCKSANVQLSQSVMHKQDCCRQTNSGNNGSLYAPPRGFWSLRSHMFWRFASKGVQSPIGGKTMKVRPGSLTTTARLALTTPFD